MIGRTVTGCIALGILMFNAASAESRQPSPRDVSGSSRPSDWTGAIAGSVRLTGSRGGPARHAVVRVAGGQPRVSRAVETDVDGRFEFMRLPPGNYTLVA